MRFRHAISVKHKNLAGFSSQIILVIARIPEHSQRQASLFYEPIVSLFVEQDRWIVAGVGVSQRLVRNVKNTVKRGYELVSFNGLPKQVVHLGHRDMWRVANVGSSAQTRTQEGHQQCG